MEFSLMTLCGLFAAYFFAGIVDSIGGGGGLITLPALMVLGFPPHLAVGTNNAVCLFGSAASTLKFIKEKKINWFIAVRGLPATFAGGWCGAWLNQALSAQFLQYIMVGIIPIMAVVLLAKKDFGRENRFHELKPESAFVLSVVIGFLSGGYSSFYGAGSGTLTIMAYSAFCRLDLVSSSAMARLCQNASNIIAVVSFGRAGLILWSAVGAAALGNVIGSYAGAALAVTRGAKLIRPMFLAALALLTVKLLWGMLV